MISARLVASTGLLVALSTASCTFPDLDFSSEPTQTATTGASAQLAGQVISTFELRSGEQPRAVLGDAVVVSQQSEDGQTTIRVVNRNNGAASWTTDGRFVDRQVQLVGTADATIVVSLSHYEQADLLAGLDPTTGDILWAIEHAGGQVQVVRGTGTALLATTSVPIVLDTTTGDELWRGEPGDQMRAVLGAAVVTSSDGHSQVLRLRDGKRIPGGIKSSSLNLAKATSSGSGTSGPGTWLLGKGALAENGAVIWGQPRAKSKAIVGDADKVAIVTKQRTTGSETNGKKWSLTLQVHETKSGTSEPQFVLDACVNGKAVGLTDGVLTWSCPTGDTRTLVNVRVS